MYDLSIRIDCGLETVEHTLVVRDEVTGHEALRAAHRGRGGYAGLRRIEAACRRYAALLNEGTGACETEKETALAEVARNANALEASRLVVTRAVSVS